MLDVERSLLKGRDGRATSEPTRQKELNSLRRTIEFLLESGLFYWMDDYEEAESNSYFDRNQIDLVVGIIPEFQRLISRPYLAVQVKSSWAQAKKCMQEKDTISRSILVLNGQAGREQNIEFLFWQLLQMIPEKHRKDFAALFWSKHDSEVYKVIAVALNGMLENFVSADVGDWYPRMTNSRKWRHKMLIAFST